MYITKCYIVLGMIHGFMEDFILRKAQNMQYKLTCFAYITYKGVCVEKIGLFYIQRKILCGQLHQQQKCVLALKLQCM